MSTLLPDPIQYVGGYTLDLYCDHDSPEHDYRHNEVRQFRGETFSECVRQARRVGWVLHKRTRTATCPKCTNTANATP